MEYLSLKYQAISSLIFENFIIYYNFLAFVHTFQVHNDTFIKYERIFLVWEEINSDLTAMYNAPTPEVWAWMKRNNASPIISKWSISPSTNDYPLPPSPYRSKYRSGYGDFVSLTHWYGNVCKLCNVIVVECMRKCIYFLTVQNIYTCICQISWWSMINTSYLIKNFSRQTLFWLLLRMWHVPPLMLVHF